MMCATQGAHAFDTGHHADLTRDALQKYGFSEDAIHVAQVENWLVDYYSTSPTSMLNQDAELLHCDNLFSTEQVRNYLDRLTANTRNAVQKAVADNDPLRLIAIMGASLHTIQDFYSHSNWIETHPNPSTDLYHTQTWFGTTVPADMNIVSGYYKNTHIAVRTDGVQVHGSHLGGLNKDAYGRPRWREAYCLAYVASYQWIGAIREWARSNDPNLTTWKAAKSLVSEGANHAKLDADIEASYRLSEWIVDLKGTDGHWKGNGSGDPANLARASGWITGADSIYVLAFKATLRSLSQGLEINAVPGEMPPLVPRIPLDNVAIILNTTRVHELDTRAETVGLPNFYAQTTLAQQTFRDTIRRELTDFAPPWETIKFVSNSLAAVPITFGIWEQAHSYLDPDIARDICPLAARREVTFNLNPETDVCSGDIVGEHSTPTTAALVAGDENGFRVLVGLTVIARSLDPWIYKSADSGPEIKFIQERLKTLGYLTATPNGNFGPATKAAVVNFQMDNGLNVDGRVGPTTWRLLFGEN